MPNTEGRASGSVGDLAADLRARNSRTNLDEDQWRPAFDAALAEALRDEALREFIEVVEVGLTRLDARGRHVELLALIDSALVLLGDGHPDAQILLMGIRATVERGLARAAAAQRTLESAELLRTRVTNPESITRYEVQRAVCMMSSLLAQPVEPLIQERLANAHHTDAALLMSWLAALWLGCGLPSRARTWVQFLHAASRAHGHIWRAADADSLQRAIDMRTYRGLDAVGESDVGYNWVAKRRLVTIHLHTALTRRNFRSAAAYIDQLAGMKRSSAAERAGESGFAALLSVYQGAPAPSLGPPEYAGLENLGGILAGAEAIALGGSLELVSTWRAWLDANLPPHILTAGEWPTSRRRIEALLAIRAGDDALAFTLLTDAIACADREHYEVEADLGRVQLAELIRTTQGKQEAWERLREAGIDAAAVGYWVASCRGAARSHRRTQITTRELGILRLMAEGLTARAAAERLGLSARTVSNHLQQVYQKLGAHSRTEAIHLARTAGLL